MERKKVLEQVQRTAGELTAFDLSPSNYIPLHRMPSPSPLSIRKLMDLIRQVVFPGFFNARQELRPDAARYYTGVYLEKIYDLLLEQVYHGLCVERENCPETHEQAAAIATSFLGEIPQIKYLLSTDVKAIMDGDPAAQSISEVIFCYPATLAVLHQRVAHELFKREVPLLPRIITEIAHSETGIDIHPGAQIGEYFSIDHGTGVVIGQTTIIGNHVRLYQGVTLGAKNFRYDDEGLPLDIPRHPIIEDHVTIYSNTSVLGRITIGKGSVIGGNIWLTEDIPPNSKILQTKAVDK